MTKKKKKHLLVGRRTHVICISLPPEAVAALDAKCESEGLTRSGAIRQMLLGTEAEKELAEIKERLKTLEEKS